MTRLPLAVLLLASGCSKTEVVCGKVLRSDQGTPGFWGSSPSTAVDLGDRVVTASGGRALLAGDKACVQLKSDLGPFITSEGATR